MFIPIGHLQVSTMLLTPPKESAIHQECIFFSVETTEKMCLPKGIVPLMAKLTLEPL